MCGILGFFGEKSTLNKNKFDALIHLAAYISVDESVRNPKKYMVMEKTPLSEFDTFSDIPDHYFHPIIKYTPGFINKIFKEVGFVVIHVEPQEEEK